MVGVVEGCNKMKVHACTGMSFGCLYSQSQSFVPVKTFERPNVFPIRIFSIGCNGKRNTFSGTRMHFHLLQPVKVEPMRFKTRKKIKEKEIKELVLHTVVIAGKLGMEGMS